VQPVLRHHHVLPSPVAEQRSTVAEGRDQHGLASLSAQNDHDVADSSVSRPP